MPVTADDVVYSFGVLKAHNASFSIYWRNVEKAEKTGEREVTFTFTQKRQPRAAADRRAADWCCRSTGGKAPTPSGRKRDITETTLEPPLGSGPYRLKSFEPGPQRCLRACGRLLGSRSAVNRGLYNFDEVHTEYYRDSTVLLEAFKADRIDFYIEGNAKEWATAYDFPARRDGRVLLEEFPIKGPSEMPVLVLNLAP